MEDNIREKLMPKISITMEKENSNTQMGNISRESGNMEDLFKEKSGKRE